MFGSFKMAGVFDDCGAVYLGEILTGTFPMLDTKDSTVVKLHDSVLVTVRSGLPREYSGLGVIPGTALVSEGQDAFASDFAEGSHVFPAGEHGGVWQDGFRWQNRVSHQTLWNESQCNQNSPDLSPNHSLGLLRSCCSGGGIGSLSGSQLGK